ncbi:MAG: 30S ribosome-binding factor RbfA, partial [Deltaproteobacteria bacterium]|nr:30S ribosome-binding factor RbfA [Deltaproteobacteria bacterium]
MSRQRLDRMNSLICSAVSELMRTKSKDPRLADMTVTKADISANLRTVKVFFSVLGGEDKRENAVAALGKATGFVRSFLAAELKLKYTP